MTNRPDWAPEGAVVIGNYAFEPPYVPTELQLEQAEQFIFTESRFEALEESMRRRNVIRLAIAAASNFMMPDEEGALLTNIVPLIGGVVQMTIERHEGSPVLTYSLL